MGPTHTPRSVLHAPDGAHDDPETACEEYEELLATLPPREIQLLGIGRNGHIGFNEPGTSLDARTHVVELHDATRADNQRHFPAGRSVPTHAITMGIGTILEARRIVLVATGDAKSHAVADAIEGPVTPACPASGLRQHAHVTVMLDPSAAAGLTQRRG